MEALAGRRAEGLAPTPEWRNHVAFSTARRCTRCDPDSAAASPSYQVAIGERCCRKTLHPTSTNGSLAAERQSIRPVASPADLGPPDRSARRETRRACLQCAPTLRRLPPPVVCQPTTRDGGHRHNLRDAAQSATPVPYSAGDAGRRCRLGPGVHLEATLKQSARVSGRHPQINRKRQESKARQSPVHRCVGA